jgi:hypothetical protein
MNADLVTKEHSMKNSIKFLGLIAIVAIMGLSFAACEGPQGPMGPQGPQGDPGTNGPKGDPGGVLTYIPAESGLLGTTWNGLYNGATPYELTFSNDGYTFTDTNKNTSSVSTYDVVSYGKRPDGTHFATALRSSNTYMLKVEGNTLTFSGMTYTKQ